MALQNLPSICQLFGIQIQKGWKVFLWSQVKSKIEARYSERILAATISLAKNLQSKGVGKKEAKKLATVGFNTFSTM